MGVFGCFRGCFTLTITARILQAHIAAQRRSQTNPFGPSLDLLEWATSVISNAAIGWASEAVLVQLRPLIGVAFHLATQRASSVTQCTATTFTYVGSLQRRTATKA